MDCNRLPIIPSITSKSHLQCNGTPKPKSEENVEQKVVVPQINNSILNLNDADASETGNDATKSGNDLNKNSKENLTVVEDDEVTLNLPKVSEDEMPKEGKKKKRFCLHTETKTATKSEEPSSETSSTRTTSQMSFVENSRIATPNSSPEETRKRRKPPRAQISKIVPLEEIGGSRSSGGRRHRS